MAGTIETVDVLLGCIQRKGGSVSIEPAFSASLAAAYWVFLITFKKLTPQDFCLYLRSAMIQSLYTCASVASCVIPLLFSPRDVPFPTTALLRLNSVS